MPTFGKRMSAGMIAVMKTVPQIAAECSVSEQMVRRWRRMERPEMSAQHLVQLANSLRCNMRWLADGSGSPWSYSHGKITKESVVELLDKLPPEAIAAWFRIGQLLLRE